MLCGLAPIERERERRYIYTCMHACMHACMDAYICMHMHACMHACTCIHTYVHACMHTLYIHTDIFCICHYMHTWFVTCVIL